jgi:internalin A
MRSDVEDLMVNDCALADFPRALLFSSNLDQLCLYSTTLPGLPAEALSQTPHANCLDSFRNHVRDLASGEREVREAKLVVLGNGRVGKTQICRRLSRLDFDEGVDSTHGITVTAVPWTHSSGAETLNVWDFGGQDIYHTTHTLFLNSSAVFLVAWHPDFEADRQQDSDGVAYRNFPLPYWLEYVRTFGHRRSPVVVVQTRCERPQSEVHRLPADNRYFDFEYLKPCWYSAKTDRGRGALNDAIGDAVLFLREHEGVATIGAGRRKVLDQLETWRAEDQRRPPAERLHRILSQQEFARICEEAGGISSSDSLLRYLHNLGVVFHSEQLFNDRIILDQSWALDAVYAVFDRRKTYKLILSQNGRFTRSLLEIAAWKEYSHADRSLFLSLMQTCNICFLHKPADPKLGTEDEYIAPDILPPKQSVETQLAGRWRESEEIRILQYDYPFLHGGLMRALICEIGSKSQDAGVYWKSGAWVYEKRSGAQAMIESEMLSDRRGRVILKTRGRLDQELAPWMLARIENANQRFGHSGLKPVIDEISPNLDKTRSRARSSVAALEMNLEESESSSSRKHAGPVFGKPPAEFFGAGNPRIFLSYAWGDSTPEGQRREKLADDVCAKLEAHGFTVLRDKDVLEPGQRISEFMDRLAAGDAIILVISDKYLRSEYCMYELFRIYQTRAQHSETFLGAVIPLILPDAGLETPASRLRRAIYWKNQANELHLLVKDNIDAVGIEPYRKSRLCPTSLVTRATCWSFSSTK